ncbi:MAG: tRNA lysidine(34) synthetase TilS [Clostridium sp.]|nr:MAG: tRNA lysidine(34) synthetase TilS [Clostridium sp.]
MKKTTNSLTLAGNKEFVKRYNLAYIIEKNVYTNDSVEINLNQEVIYKQKNIGFISQKNIGNTNAKYIKLCYNRLAFPFMIRSYKENDEILMPYGHKKINRLFIDNKIPKEERLDIPVIEMNKEVIWVYNLAKSKMVLDMKDCYDIYFVCEVLDIEK